MNNFDENVTSLPQYNNNFTNIIIAPKIMNDIILKFYEKIDKSYLINENDSKIINFLINYLFNSKKSNFRLLIKKRQTYNKINIGQYINFRESLCSTKLIMKFINIFIVHIKLFENFTKVSKELLNRKIYFLIKKLFIKDIISVDDMNIILVYKLIVCLLPENIDLKSNFIPINNNKIENIKELYSLFEFLLSFIKNPLDEKNKIKFKHLCENVIENMNSILLNGNKNNIFVLAKNDYAFKLIQLTKISNEITLVIIPFLVKIYNKKFNIDYIFNDLSDQFTLKNNENIENLTNYLIAKNSFLIDLFSEEEKSENKFFINNGFMFNKDDYNGIICSLSDSKPKSFPSEGFSAVISFCLMNNNVNNKYNIFSFYGNERNDFISLYIEKNNLKFRHNAEAIILNSEILINKEYILWIIYPKDNSKEIILILNGFKSFVKSLKYPSFQYKELLIGFDRDSSLNNKSINNFEGIIGTLIFFNECLIKGKNDTKIESKINELKGYYEMIVNAQDRRDFIDKDKEVDLTLKKFLNFFLNINNKIEFIISTKSIGNIQDIKEINNKYICNYYDYDISNQNKEYFEYQFVSSNSISNNITYPVEYSNSLLEFFNNHGLIYLNLELYFLMGVLSFKIDRKNSANNDNKSEKIYLNDNEIEEMNEKLEKICLLFFQLFKLTIYPNIYEKYKIGINNFFYTLNDLISINVKYGCKLRENLLMLFINKIQSSFSNDLLILLIEKCDFIFMYDYYDEKDKQVCEKLFINLISIIDEESFSLDKDSIKLIKLIFKKIINFQKIYLQEKVSKVTKNKYSQLIQKLLFITIKEKEYSLIEIYFLNLEKIINEIKDYLINFEKMNNIFNMEFFDEELPSENNISSEEKNDKNILDINKINNIKLIYKYLKNLFIIIDLVKDIFIDYCIGKKSLFKEFFNGLNFFLIQEFDINVNKYKINFDNTNEKEIKKIQEGYYSELIKSLCIILLDEIFVKKKKKSNSFISNYIPPKIRKSLGSIKKKFSLSKNNEYSNILTKTNTYIPMGETNEKNNANDNNLGNINNNDINPTKNEINNLNLVLKNIEFLKELNLSKQTLSCLYILIFNNNISHKEAVYFLKKIGKNEVLSDFNGKLIISEEDIVNNKHYFHLINILVEKISKDSDNYELIKFCFELGSNIMIKISQFYFKKNYDSKEEILGFFLTFKDNCLFNISINSLSKLSNEINKEENSDKNIDIKKNLYNEFSKLIKDNLLLIIDNTLFDFKDPFHFTLLIKCYFNNNIDSNYILGLISFMINKFIECADEDSNQNDFHLSDNLNQTIIKELNNKNILILLYKILFYIPKRKFIIDNVNFIKCIYTYLDYYKSYSKLLFIKILFPIEDFQSTLFSKKLIIEIIYEIMMELYIEYVQAPQKKYLECFEDLMYNILNAKNFSQKLADKIVVNKKNRLNKKKDKKKYNHTLFYILDKISFKDSKLIKIADEKNEQKKDKIKDKKKVELNIEFVKKFNEILFDKYKMEKENTFSICIIFLIKILISFKNLEEIFENKKIIKRDFILKDVFKFLCEDSYLLTEKFSNLNPLVVEGKYNNGLYSYFKDFIINEYKIQKNDDINNLSQKLLNYANDQIYFTSVIYKNNGNIIPSIYRNAFDTEAKSDLSENSTSASEEPKNQNFHKAKTSKEKLNKKYELNLISKNYEKEHNDRETNIYYVEKLELKSEIMRIYFSAYFLKMLNYDKDFIIIKKLYRYLYSNEIVNIDDFNDFCCPLKFKNYIPNAHYFRPFLKKDFRFFDSGYLEYSHPFLFKKIGNKSFSHLRSKNIFPSKDILYLSDYPNNKLDLTKVKHYYCELLTNQGSIFGKFFLLENGVLFLSDCKWDKRNDENYLDFILSTTKFDILKENKKIFLNYNKISEIINRTFCFHWTSQEIFIKNGKSYFFNFFKEKSNEEIFNIYKSKLKKLKNIIIQNPKEYFENEDFTKKYKNNEISTFEYLLLINKYSSRSYNNTSEYPIMPWVKFGNNIRNFDLPMSLQTNEALEYYEDKYNKFQQMQSDLTHTNHYSNAPYILFYLYRINPFSNAMIKFQGNCFDIPERQFSSIDTTIKICPRTSNNREPIPEIFEMPEIYYNINCNDLGKLRNEPREHNMDFSPYAKNGFEFCYDLLDQINNDIEINLNINKWIDFIFGVNQFINNPTTKKNSLRKFSDEFYSQNSTNFEKQISELKEKKVDEKQIYNNIKSNLESPLNFGLCPIPILTEATPKKNIINPNSNENKDTNDEIQNLKNIPNNSYSNKMVYFKKNVNNKNIIILYEKGLLQILSPKKKNIKEYDILTEIRIKGVLYPNLVAKYTFCELKENFFIFCGFLDKTLKFYQKDKNEFNYLLKIHTTSIISINEKVFITGHFNGKLIKWELLSKSDNNQINYELKKIGEIKSNKSSIYCIEYDIKLNILLLCDNNSIIIRSYYNFEFLAHIKIKDFSNSINKIIKVKMFNCNLIYALVMLNDNNKSYELHCYSLNGAFHKKIEGNFTDFKLTKIGNIIINALNNNEIVFYKGCHLSKLYSKHFSFIHDNKNAFLFDFQNPNIIYLCCKDNEYTSIKKAIINIEEQKDKII